MEFLQKISEKDWFNIFIEYGHVFISDFLPLLITILLIVIFSAILSAFEISLLVISDAKVLKLSKKKLRKTDLLVYVKKNMTQSVGSIVAMNNFINIMGTTILTQQTVELLGQEYTTVSAVVLTFVVIVYGKIIPKIIGERYHESLAILAANFVFYISFLLKPFTYFVDLNAKLISKDNNYKIEEDDIRYQLKIAKEKGGLSKNKFSYLESIFHLTNKKVFDIMTPSTQLEYLNEKDNVYDQNIQQFVKSSSHSRIIVVSKDINHIRGYVLKSDILLQLIDKPNMEKLNTSRLTKPVLIVEDSININNLLEQFQSQNHLIAVVKNKFGVTLGVVTLEDIIEQIIGEITDETDKYNNLRKRGNEKFQKFMKEQKKNFKDGINKD